MTFGEKLQKLRKEKGWTQEQLAEQINISRQALSKWELGTAIPDTENVVQISKVFQVSTDYLLNDEYKSDEDLRAVHISKKVSNFYNNKIHVIVGLCISSISLLALFIVAILSSVYPAVYSESPATMEWTRTYTGLMGFLKINNLEWLFVLLIIMFAIGMAVVFYPKFKSIFSNYQKQ